MVKQQAAILSLEKTSMHQKGPIDDKSSEASGSKHSCIARKPHQNTAKSAAQDGCLVSPPLKNQHIVANNTASLFMGLAKFNNITIGMLLPPLSSGISVSVMGCSFVSVIYDSNQQKCTITFDWAQVAGCINGRT